MIKIVTNKKLVKHFSTLLLTDKGKYISVKSKLKELLVGRTEINQNEVINYIIKNLERIIISEPRELQDIIKHFISQDFQNVIYNNGRSTEFGIEIYKAFNYNGFRRSAKAKFIVEGMNIKTCVYCNSQYNLVVKHNNKVKLLFHLDHYFSKDKYPYLSLSYYNLIPCCSNCNMNKSNKDFSIEKNIHPHIISIDELARFKVDGESLVKYLLNPVKNEDLIKVQLKLKKKHLGNLPKEQLLMNYKEEFNIEGLYSQFNDVVGETYLKSIYYNKARKKELINLLNKKCHVDLNEEMINRFIIGNYTESQNLLKRPLAKLMKDIGEDLKIV